MSSNTARKEELDAESDDSNSVSSKPENNDKQPHMRRSDTSSTTNEPSSASATATAVSTAAAKHPTPRSGLPTFAAAAAAAAPRVPLKEKKTRRAGFREQFLQKLRVMLDRESQNDSTAVQWSTDGNSFIITDQNQFVEHIIPTYFDNPIAFASFLNKLYRWGFNRVSSRRAGRYEFCSPTFKRLDSDSEPAAIAAAINTTGNDGGGAPIQVQQQQIQAFSSSLQQVMVQTNQLLASNPVPTSQADANNAITDLLSNLISNIQRQLSSQQPFIPSQQSVSNQNTNPLNNTDANSILQGIMSSNQQQLLSPHSTPSHQPVLNQSTNNPLNMNHILQSFQQRQHPNTTLNLLNTAVSILAGGQAPSSAQLMGHPSPSSQSNNAVHALMSLCGMMLPQPTLPNINTTISADMSQLLVFLMQRVVGEEVQRRAQIDAIQNAVMTTIGQNTGQGGSPNNNIVQTTQQDIIPRSMQTLGSNNSNTAQLQQVGTPPSPSAGNLNIQADSIAAILQAARRGDAAGQLQEYAHGRNGPDHGGDEDNSNGHHEGRQPSPRKRKSPDDDQYDTDDDSWTERLRPRKMSPRE